MQLENDIEQKVYQASLGFTLSVENVLQVGFNLFRKSPGIFIIYGIIGLVTFSNPVSGLLLTGPVVAGFYIVADKIKNDSEVKIPDFFKSFEKFVPLVTLNLLMSLIIFTGLILLVIPGILYRPLYLSAPTLIKPLVILLALIPGIYFIINFLFAYIFVWFYDVNPAEAIRLSRKTVSGNFGQILLLCLVLGGINLLGVLAFGIGILLSVPFNFCAIYAAFDDIIGIPKS